MLMVGIRGSHLNAASMTQTRQQIQQGDIGGIIFFKQNIKNSRQFRIFVKGIAALPAPQPLFLAIDEEGGRIKRLRKSKGFEEFPSAAYIGDHLDSTAAFALYLKMAQQISNTGLNLNLGPVVDVNINRTSPAIGQLNRSFSRNPGKVYTYGAIFIQAHHTAGILTTLKHYPGHGSSREDTHHDLTDITYTWRSSEQLPFKRLIDSARVDLIMAGHLFDRNVDPDHPASLSKAHIQRTLRDKLGYEGVVITDDLQMGAIIKRYTLEEMVVAAINAGCDILQFSDPLTMDPDLPGRVQDIVLRAIHDGRLDQARINESYRRIISLKQQLADQKRNQHD